MEDFAPENYLLDSRRGNDPAERRARKVIGKFFEDNREGVFFSRQIEVIHERDYFHWISARAIRGLIAEGLILMETRRLGTLGEIHLLWHNKYRYHRRAAAKLVKLVEEYASPNVGGALGSHGELIVLEGFATQRFVLEGRNTSEYKGQKWAETGHNLDFIFEREGCAYGVEVKNTLGYMEYEELKAKIRLSRGLGIRPVFVARMLPKIWINEVQLAGGFCLILKYQLYPRSFRDLAKRVASELRLPVDSPRALNEGTMLRFVNWHARNV